MDLELHVAAIGALDGVLGFVDDLFGRLFDLARGLIHLALAPQSVVVGKGAGGFLDAALDFVGFA